MAFDFDTLRSKGFIPTLAADVNGDGLRDLVGPGEGARLEVQLGARGEGFQGRRIGQACDTGGRIRFGDLEGDKRADFVITPRAARAHRPCGHNRGVRSELCDTGAAAGSPRPNALLTPPRRAPARIACERTRTFSRPRTPAHADASWDSRCGRPP